MEDQKTTIDITKDGPLIVNNLAVLENSRGEQIECKKNVALCRCGDSNNKPFCDGSHKRTGFSGDPETKLKLEKEKEYKGKNISIFYNIAICYHAAECVNNLPAVFDSKSRPWINPDGSDKQSIIDTIRKCPSGALSYKVGDAHTREFINDSKIRIQKDGPYQVMGKIKLNVNDELKPAAKERYALCRCGSSKTKPFCDGSHTRAGFTDNKN